MALKLVSGPALEPLTVAEAKAHLRIDASDEDGLIASLITTARLQVEAALGLALNAQQWVLLADFWPLNGIVELPVRPLQSVTEIRVRDGSGSASVVDPLHYTVDGAGDTPRIASRTGYWPTPGARLAGIEIEFEAGFGAAAADVPADIRQALLLLVGHWFEHRDPADADQLTGPVPAAVSSLLARFKVARL